MTNLEIARKIKDLIQDVLPQLGEAHDLMRYLQTDEDDVNATEILKTNNELRAMLITRYLEAKKHIKNPHNQPICREKVIDN